MPDGRGIFPADKAEDAGGLSPVKADNAVMETFGPEER